MPKKQTIVSFVMLCLLSCLVGATDAPLLTRQQFIDYSVANRCADLKYHDDPAKLEAELLAVEERFNITEDDFDRLDETISFYEKDKALLDAVQNRVVAECAG